MINPLPFSPIPSINTWDPETRYLYEERAGILEFEGGMSREDAEAAALEEIRGRFEQ